MIKNKYNQKSMETNKPLLNPGDDYLIPANSGAIILGAEV